MCVHAQVRRVPTRYVSFLEDTYTGSAPPVLYIATSVLKHCTTASDQPLHAHASLAAVVAAVWLHLCAVDQHTLIAHHPGVFPMGPLVAGSLVQVLFPDLSIYSLAATSVFSVP
jgi:hypothetical protein